MDHGKHACLILVHTQPAQVRTLLSLLDDPRNDIYVHIDRKAPFGAEALDGCCVRSTVHFIEPRISIHWGGSNMMLATLALLRAATATPHAYYHLFSGQDLPIKDQDTIHAFFAAHAGQEFLQFWPSAPSETRRATNFCLFPESAGVLPAKIANKLVRGVMKPFGGINRDLDLRLSSSWFSITDACARYVVSREAWLKKRFVHTMMPDEVFIGTVIWDSPFRERIFDDSIHLEREEDKRTLLASNLRLIDWARGSTRHPWVFREEDWDLLVGSPCLWARKFDRRVDARIIERLEKQLKVR
ncbi:Core-2/I-Branching enzyme [Bacteroidales bacterium WCE2004]|nr:Core-2/I-Branching enzyme [Bacteroidales bacterium WCE2004]